MRQIILLYWGSAFLLYLSGTYYPAGIQLNCDRIDSRHYMWKKSDVFMIVAIFWLSATSFLRETFNDTYNYINFFQHAVSTEEFISDGGLTNLTGNPLSYFYQSLMHDVTDNYHIYFLVPAVMSSFAVVKLFKRYSVNPAFSLLIFFSIGTYLMYVAALKQCFAMFFLLLSIPYAVDKKYLRFYFLVFVAVLFHTHAFMFAILPLLLDKPWGKKIWILFFATLFAMGTYKVTLGTFMNYAQSLGAFVAEDEVFDGNQINVIRVIVYWIPALIALIFRNRLFYNSTRVENLFVNMSIVSAFILMIGLVEGANLYARMAGYFEIATAVALPWMIKKIFNHRSARIVTYIAVLCYFGYFLYELVFTKGFDADYSAITLWQFIQSLFV